MRRLVPIAAIAAVVTILGATAYAQSADSGPGFVSAVLDGTTGELVISFDDNVDLLALDGAKLHIREQGKSTGGITLDGEGMVPSREGAVYEHSHNIGSGLGTLRGIAVNGTDHIFVASTDQNRVHIFDPSGIKLGDFRRGTGGSSFNSPHGVAVDRNNGLIIAEIGSGNDGRIQVFLSETDSSHVPKHLRTIDRLSDNSRPGNLNYVALDSSGRILVTDQSQDKVHIFEPGGNHIGSFDAVDGTGNPLSVAVGSDGSIYVSDSSNAEVNIFDSDGNRTGKLIDISIPAGIEISHGMIYVVSANADSALGGVNIFGPDGTSLDKIILIDQPYDIAFDSNDRMLVSTSNGGNIHVLVPTLAEVSLVLDPDTLRRVNAMDRPVLDVEAGAVHTAGGDPVTASIDNQIIMLDDTKPIFELARLDNATGDLSIYLDEQVNPFATDPAKLHIREQGQSEGGVTLSANPVPRDDMYNFDSYLATNATGPNQVIDPSDIAVASDGDIIVSGNHCVKIFHTNGTTAQIGTCGTKGSTNELFNFTRGVAVNGMDHIFVADVDNHRIQVFGPGGGYERTIGVTLAPGDAFTNFQNPGGVAVDASGRVIVADTKNSRVAIFDPGSDTTKLGNLIGFGKRTGTFFPGSGAGEFERPSNVATNGTHIFVADTNNHRIQVFKPNTDYVAEFGLKDDAGSPIAGNGTGEFQNPLGVAVDASGRIIVADTGNHRVQVLGPDGAYITEFGSLGTGDGNFTRPRGVAVHGLDILVADTGNDRIQRFTPTVEGSTHIIQDVTPHLYQSAGSYGTEDVQFRQPSGIALYDGRIIVADSQNHRIQILDSAGNSVETIGNTTDGVPVPGDGDEHFHWPRGVAVNGSGHIFVADANNDRVQILDSNGRFAGSIAPSQGYDLDGPHGVAIGDGGRILVAARSDNTVEVFYPNGTHVRTIDGSEDGGLDGPEGVAEGAGMIVIADTKKDRVVVFDSSDFAHVDTFGTPTGGTAFDKPRGVAIDTDGRIWVSDTNNNRVQVLDRDGTLVYGFGSEGGGDTELRKPRGIAIDGTGRAWVADTGNHRVQTFTFASDGLSFTLTPHALSAVNATDHPELDIDAAAVTDPVGNLIDKSYDNPITTDTTPPVVDFVGVVPGSGTVGDGGSLHILLSSEMGLSIHTNSTINGRPIKADMLSFESSSNYTITHTVSRGDPRVADGDMLPAYITLYDAARNPSAPITEISADSAPGIDGEKAAVTLDGRLDPDAGLVRLTFSHPVSIQEISQLQITGDGSSGTVDLSDPGNAELSTGGAPGYGNPSEFDAGDVQFNQPSDIVFNSTGYMFVVDSGNHCIRMFDPNGTHVGNITRGDSCGSTNVGHESSQFRMPRGVATNGTHIFVADTDNNRVQVFGPGGNHIDTFVSDVGAWSEGMGDREFDDPNGIDVSPDGLVFVADTENLRIQILDSDGRYVDEIPPKDADEELFFRQLTDHGPQGVAADQARIFAADTNGHRIWILDAADLSVIDTIGETDSAGDPVSGTADGAFDEPRGMALDGRSNLYVADTDNNRIQIFRPDGFHVQSVDSTSSGTFSSPRGVTMDNDGRMWVADTGNNRLHVFNVTHASEFVFRLTADALLAVQGMEDPRIDIDADIRSADGITLAQSYEVRPPAPPGPDTSLDPDDRISVNVAVPELQDRSTVTRSSSGGGGTIIIDSLVSGIGDGTKSVLYRAYWETSDDGSTRTLYIVAGQDGGGIPHVRVNAPESGRTDAAVSASQPYPGRTLFEAQLLPSDSFVVVYVGDAQQKLFQLDGPDDDVTVTQYSGPDDTSTAMDEQQDMTEQPDMTEGSDAEDEEQPPAMEPPLQPELDSSEAMTPEDGAMEEQSDGQVVDPEPTAPAGAGTDADTTTDTSEGDGGCLIATAAYGTELAPQVQALREVRDGTLAGTSSGAAFMGAFNSMYYVFSPAVSDLQREHPAVREATKLLLTPMLYTLHIMSMADDESSVLGLGLSVIALNIGMYLAAPAFAGYAVYKHRKNI